MYHIEKIYIPVGCKYYNSSGKTQRRTFVSTQKTGLLSYLLMCRKSRCTVRSKILLSLEDKNLICLFRLIAPTAGKPPRDEFIGFLYCTPIFSL